MKDDYYTWRPKDGDFIINYEGIKGDDKLRRQMKQIMPSLIYLLVSLGIINIVLYLLSRI